MGTEQCDSQTLLNELEAKLRAPDTVMENNVGDLLREYLKAGGKPLQAIGDLSDNFIGKLGKLGPPQYADRSASLLLLKAYLVAYHSACFVVQATACVVVPLQISPAHATSQHMPCIPCSCALAALQGMPTWQKQCVSGLTSQACMAPPAAASAAAASAVR